MSPALRLSIVALSLLLVANPSPAFAVAVGDVTAIRITNQSPDGWYYVEEYTIPNAGGTDVASLSFGTTASGDFGTGFGSSINGGINDLTSNCCGNGTHSNSNNGGLASQQYTMSLPSPQTFNLNDGSTTMRVDDRQDSTCCTDRPFNFKMEMLTAGGGVAAERAFQTSDFALTGTGGTGSDRFGTVALDDFAINIARNENVKQVIGASNAVNSPNVIADGNVGDTAGDAMFISGVSTIPQGFGYDLGGFGTVDTVRIYQHSAAGGGGTRQRLETVNVHTSQGTLTFNALPDTDIIELDLGGIETAYVLIDPVSQYNNAPDQQLGIREVELLSTNATIKTHENVALGKSVTLEGSGWGFGAASDITDGATTWGPDLSNFSTAVFNNQFSANNGSWVIDLGEVELINRIGLMQQTFGGGGPRNMIQDMILEFSNDNFGTTLGSVNLTLEDGVIYQQLGFDAVYARYVRFNPTSQHSYGSDPRIGIVEAQVFAIPEPATFGLLGLAGMTLLGRRRAA